MSDCFDGELYAAGFHLKMDGIAAPTEAEDDASNIAAIYETLRGSVYFYLLASGLPCADADDLTQESFIRLHALFRCGHRVENVRSWLFRVAHNLRIDRVRTCEWRVAGAGEQWQNA